jgi:hypothetical protein
MQQLLVKTLESGYDETIRAMADIFFHGFEWCLRLTRGVCAISKNWFRLWVSSRFERVRRRSLPCSILHGICGRGFGAGAHFPRPHKKCARSADPPDAMTPGWELLAAPPSQKFENLEMFRLAW